MVPEGEAELRSNDQTGLPNSLLGDLGPLLSFTFVRLFVHSFIRLTIYVYA